MRPALAFASAAWMVAAALTAPAPAGVARPEADVRAVERAEHAWMEAMQNRDKPSLERVVAPAFTLAGLDDLDRHPLSRAVWMDNALHHLQVHTVSFRKLSVTVAGEVAIARSLFTWSGSFDREEFNDTSVLVDTWVRQGNRWVVVSRLVGDAPAVPQPASGK